MKFMQKIIAGLASLALAFPIITASTTPVKAESLDIPDGAKYTVAISEWNNDYVLLSIHAIGPKDGNAGNTGIVLSTCGAEVYEEDPKMTVINQGPYFTAADEQGLAYISFFPLHQNAKVFADYKVAKSDLTDGKTLNCEAVFYSPIDVDTEEAYIDTADDYQEFSGYIRQKGTPIAFSVTLGEPLKTFTAYGMQVGNVDLDSKQAASQEVKKEPAKTETKQAEPAKKEEVKKDDKKQEEKKDTAKKDDAKKDTEKKETTPTATPEVKESSVPETPTPTAEATKEESKQSNNSMIWIGCGIVVVIIAGVVIAKKKK